MQENVQNIYLIEGDDAYFRDSAVAAIREACAVTQPLMNTALFEGDTLKGDALSSFLGSLYTPPLFDERRFVRVNGLYLTEHEWSAIKSYFDKPCPSTVLVVVNTLKKQGVDLKRKSGVTYIDCSRADEETLGRMVFSALRKAGLKPDNDAVGLMVRYCVQDAARLMSEIKKLVSLLGEGGVVTRQVVEDYVPKDTEYKIYELTGAASRKNYDAFMQIMYELLEKGFDEIALLSSLCSHYRTLCEIASSKESDAALAQILNLKAFAVTKNREAVARLGAGRVRELYQKLYALSCGSKSGIYNKSGALTAAVANIFFG